jgi:aspartate/methionine/tyrosine aminotransferase
MAEGVATVFGSCFGRHFTDSIRISFSATPVPLIHDAAERFHRVFRSR